jgi:polyhydroxybutyrate depolymerase
VTPVGLDDTEGATSPTDSDVAAPPTAVAQPSGPCPEAATLTAGDTTKTLTVDGIERTFLVHAPPGYDGATRMPVVFDFHGLGTQNTLQKQISRWDDVGDAQGFITVYPQGVGNSWNAGGCCGDSQEQQVDDVGFVRAIITNLTNEACIDTRRVFSSGCSNGGAMSYRLACEAADVIAAIAPVDFDCVVGGQCGDCAPSRPITEVQFRGTNDQLVPYEGNGNFFLGAQGNLATWGEINACSGDQAPLAGLDGCESFPMCGEGAQTVLCTVQGGTHCGSYGSFEIAEKAWSILENVVLP